MKSWLNAKLRFITRRLHSEPLQRQRVLITGAAGAIGRAVGEELVRRGHWVRGFDLLPPPEDHTLQEWAIGDFTDPATLESAIMNIDMVVHLAAKLEDRPFEPDLADTNVCGVYRVFEAARRHAIKRVVLASSCNTVFWHTQQRRQISADFNIAPLDLYSVTKAFAEHLGWLYGNHHGVPTISLRYGWLPRDEESERKLLASPSHHDWYLSRGDAARATALAVEAPQHRTGKYCVAYVTSRPKSRGPFDLRPARRLLDFIPGDTYIPRSLV